MHRTLNLRGHDGTPLVADAWGDPQGQPVLMLHGGGQTRHAWKRSGQALARRGFHALTIDLRGHGDSGWSHDGVYSIERFALDLVAVAAGFTKPPVVVGASLGGIAGMIACAGHDFRAAALVLVDVTPTLQRSGVERIRRFMSTARADGFASLDEAAEAVRRFAPDRPSPASTEGLRKNLRLGQDGRYRWHWDPAFLDFVDQHAGDDFGALLAPVARALRLPVLLVRGSRSDVVSSEDAAFLLHLVPGARWVDISDAAHMVAGDSNDAFTEVIVEFLEGLQPARG